MALRKRASAMTAAEQQRFINVYTQLCNAPGDPNLFGQLVNIHSQNHSQHGGANSVFLPWHRLYLLKMEQMGQAIDPLFFIPYWRWTVQKVVPPWLANFKPTVKVPGPNIVVTRNPGAPPPLPTAAQIRLPSGVLARTTFPSFTAQLENPYHNNVHVWVHGTMATIPTAPADPLFWMHHAQCDRLWSIWQTAHPGLNPANTQLHPWPETANQVRSITTLGYSYQAGLP